MRLWRCGTKAEKPDGRISRADVLYADGMRFGQQARDIQILDECAAGPFGIHALRIPAPDFLAIHEHAAHAVVGVAPKLHADFRGGIGR